MELKRIDFIDVLALRLREAGLTDAKVARLADVSNGGVAVRRMPSTTTAEGYDGSRFISLVCQVVVARESELQAIEECQAVANMARGLDLRSLNGSYRLTSAQVYTEPQELSQGAVTIWECRIIATITTN
jgi:hypothetical protein